MTTSDQERAAPAQQPVASCMDCGLAYSDDRFPDLIVPHDVWKHIAPGDGLLCPNCLCGRVARNGIECKAVFRSGPFFEDAASSEPELRAEIVRLQETLDTEIKASRAAWSRVEALSAEVGKLTEALEPFANVWVAKQFPDGMPADFALPIKVGDLRRARAALDKGDAS